MINIALLMNLPDEELLNQLDDAASHSPIIKLLHDRLTEAIKQKESDVTNPNIDCPVCMAALIIEEPEGYNNYNVIIKS